MKRIVDKLVTDEKGQAMVLCLILLLVGSLLLTPLLNFMGTGLLAGQRAEARMEEYYAADAGVEDALWNVQSASASLPAVVGEQWTYTTADMLNGKTVNVTITNISATVGGIFETTTFRIDSVATSGDSTTAIRSYINMTGAWFLDDLPIIEGDFTLGYGEEYEKSIYVDSDIILGADSEVENEDESGDLYVYAGGDISLGAGAEIEAESGDLYVYAGGDILVGKDAEIGSQDGDVYIYAGGSIIIAAATGDEDGEIEAENGNVYIYAEEDIILGPDTKIEAEDGDIYIYAGRNMTLADGAEIEAENGDICIYVGGNLTIDSVAEIEAEDGNVCICVGGDVILGEDVEITGDFYVERTITIGNGAEVTGDIYTDNPVLGDGNHIGDVNAYQECLCWEGAELGLRIEVWEIN